MWLYILEFLIQTLVFYCSYMYGLLRKQMQEMEASVHLGMAKDEVKWLAVYAFQKVLCRKQSRYSELLVLMKNELDKLSPSTDLSSAIDKRRSSMFKQIIYWLTWQAFGSESLIVVMNT